ncbi:Carbon-nitrogen hydrolase [Kalmanozyma brasiliensis GHG001]|uniref:CN hydrolase domain-containing protein n=1 Tax=Kalmanozyma brasiliensis (strain GHG001) TaxID=1365824 RepID=V5EYU3_KALBG|nr:Carbon-nitrogen hydrolase [Kalmanozyma brasiliensis GHG001]EST07989.1 Carbon-nitrogen hydrolase [Kalmanozyma brasiliensis GHG001]
MQTTLPSRPKRIACIQLDPKHADVEQNTDNVLGLVNRLIAERKTNPVDLLVLPELALTGYVFESRQEIEPLLEDARIFKGPTAALEEHESQTASALIASCKSSCRSSKQPSLTLASHLARYLACHVVIGFPELGSHQSSTSEAVSAPFDARPVDVRSAPSLGHNAAETEDLAFNSAALFSPTGALIHVFRKHFLFETDEIWATPGPGFESIRLPGLGTVCVGICMDLNPYLFATPFDACELASFCVQRNVDLLIMPMAWLLPKDEQDKEQTSLSTVNYWALRCRPFFDREQKGEDRTRYLVATNRAGIEGESVFAGSSSVLQMKGGERPVLLDSLGAREEACLLVTLPE